MRRDGFVAANILEAFCEAFIRPAGVPAPVHVVCADVGDRMALSAAEALVPMLDREQRERLDGYRCTRARAESLMGIALARFGIASLAGIPLGAVRLARSKGGKPVAVGHGGAEQVRFSIAHSGGRVLCGFSVRGDLGLDIETAARASGVGVAMQYFSSSERDDLARQPDSARLRVALRQWTLKEAYLKAIGTGLLRDLASFSIHLRGEAYVVEDSARPGDAGRWVIRNRVEASGDTWSVVWDRAGGGAVKCWRLAGARLVYEGDS
ncbi:hypothetical protein CO641_14435 [Lysobacteraceae bacterium NML91-0213]|nr:hypothetical protein CO641_14435 [Xanthomonadaceae bacterium NML91-0213]